jgi:lysophospholipase L1-like esterase
MIIKPDDRILFTGDSITDSNRRGDKNHPLGMSGYVLFAAAGISAQVASPKLEIYNRGIGGNRVKDLLGRFDADLLALKPTVVSILIGINDTWRAFDRNDPTSTEAYEADYRTILTRIRDELGARVVLLEPFLLHVPPDRATWRTDLNPRIDVVRKLVLEFGTELIPLDGLFAQAATQAPPAFWAEDGVHPTIPGHQLIAKAWLKNAGIE